MVFGVRVQVTFHLLLVHINFSFEERAAHSVDHIFSLFCDCL